MAVTHSSHRFQSEVGLNAGGDHAHRRRRAENAKRPLDLANQFFEDGVRRQVSTDTCAQPEAWKVQNYFVPDANRAARTSSHKPLARTVALTLPGPLHRDTMKRPPLRRPYQSIQNKKIWRAKGARTLDTTLARFVLLLHALPV